VPLQRDAVEDAFTVFCSIDPQHPKSFLSDRRQDGIRKLCGAGHVRMARGSSVTGFPAEQVVFEGDVTSLTSAGDDLIFGSQQIGQPEQPGVGSEYRVGSRERRFGEKYPVGAQLLIDGLRRARQSGVGFIPKLLAQGDDLGEDIEWAREGRDRQAHGLQQERNAERTAVVAENREIAGDHDLSRGGRETRGHALEQGCHRGPTELRDVARQIGRMGKWIQYGPDVDIVNAAIQDDQGNRGDVALISRDLLKDAGARKRDFTGRGCRAGTGAAGVADHGPRMSQHYFIQPRVCRGESGSYQR
jgi:hypothetical protein